MDTSKAFYFVYVRFFSYSRLISALLPHCVPSEVFYSRALASIRG